MSTIGYTVMCERLGRKELIRNAEQAEEAGFDFAVISDHFHPWLEEEGQMPVRVERAGRGRLPHATPAADDRGHLSDGAITRRSWR